MRFLARFSFALLTVPYLCSAQSIYYVSIDTSPVKGAAGKLVFDITSNRPLTNRVDLINFLTDGVTGLPETQGELVSGDLILNSNPAKSTRMKAYGFFTELALPFQSFGTRVNFVVNASETGPQKDAPPDLFSVYLLDEEGQSLTSSRVGDSTPAVSITITGERGGKVSLAPNGRKTFKIGEPYESPSKDAADSPEVLRRATVAFNVTPGWIPDDPTQFTNAKTFSGPISEFCNRRCDGTDICTGGAFGIQIDANTFYIFDDVSNLKTQVAMVNAGFNPLGEGHVGSAKVVGVVNGSTLTIQTISF
jgi:hypothetical protein